MPHKNIFKKVLFCTDFNTDAGKAFLYALNVCEGNKNSELILLHAIPEPDAQFWKSYIYEVDDVDEKAKADIDRKIEETYRPLIPTSQKWRSCFTTGRISEKILETAEKEKADLIVIGRGHGANIINRILGNYTEKLVRKAHCPVLVVPEEASVE